MEALGASSFSLKALEMHHCLLYTSAVWNMKIYVVYSSLLRVLKRMMERQCIVHLKPKLQFLVQKCLFEKLAVKTLLFLHSAVLTDRC